MNKLKAFSVVSAGFMLLSVLGCVSSKPLMEKPLVGDGYIMVPGESLTEKLAWLESNADSHNAYIVEVNANENVAPRTFEYTGATDIAIVLRGVGENRTLRLASHGTMFTIRPNVELILDSNVTLMGHSQNTGPMVNVAGGWFVMRTGSSISGNDRGSGDGGGVYVGSGRFVMTGGTISNNTAENGGGVYVRSGSFFMSDGIISGNIAGNQGGGVYWNGDKGFNIVIGTITGNTARNQGGGVYLARGALSNSSQASDGASTDLIMLNSSGTINGNVTENEEGISLGRGDELYAYNKFEHNNFWGTPDSKINAVNKTIRGAPDKTQAFASGLVVVIIGGLFLPMLFINRND
jgi:hypothetical protein